MALIFSMAPASFAEELVMPAEAEAVMTEDTLVESEIVDEDIVQEAVAEENDQELVEEPEEPEVPEAPARPAKPTLTNLSTGVKVTWKAMDGVDGYHIYRGTKVVLDTFDPTRTTFTDTSAKTSGTSYKYKIVAFKLYNGDAKVVSEPSATATIKYLSVPKVTLSSGASGMIVKWNQVTGAKSYRIYRKSGTGSYTLIKTMISGSVFSYTDKSRTNGTSYTYYVRAYSDVTDGKASGYYSSYKSVSRTYLTRPTVSSLSNSSSGKMLVKWSKNSKATGYQIQYSTSKTFASGNKTVTLTKYSTVSKTITGLTKNKTYYVRMRSYKTVSGVKQYSAYSTAKSLKITK